MRFMKDDVEGTPYEKTVSIMRDDPFFYKNQAMQQIGLHKIDPALGEGNSSASLAYTLEHITDHYGLRQTNHYYTYGWTGLLSSKFRYRDAKAFFIELEKEVQSYRAKNINPKVRVIGYSHGGNIGLNLGAVRQNEFPRSELVVDELILLGTPIIADSDYLVNDQIFKRVFHLYSEHDRVQTLDFFSPNRLFSDRVFRPRKDFQLPDKLVQIQLKVTRCIPQARNNPKRFQTSFNFDNPSVVFGKRKLLRDVSPGHAELWFFGWTPMHYRESYPLYPLPTISFMPVITVHAAHISRSLNNPGHSVIADIRPEHGVILFRPHNSPSIHSTVPFMPEEKLSRLHEAVLGCKPLNYSGDIYQVHVQEAIKKAQVVTDSPKKA